MDKRIVKAKIHLMVTNPFWGSLITRLELKDWNGDTFATNGRYIYCPDKKYIENWTDKEIVGVLAHETWHCAGGHLFRMGNKELMRWNVASDFATNYLLTKNSFILPEGALSDIKYDAMTPEKIYPLLPKGKNGNKNDGEGTGESGNGNELPNCPQDLKDPEKNEGKEKNKSKETKINIKELEQEWKEGITTALEKARSQGSLPSSMEEYINEILIPKVNWQEILFRYLQTAKGTADYVSYPFNRMHIHREIFLPSLQGEMIEVVCSLDTSGSISKNDLIRYFSEIRGICSMFGSYIIHLFQCDTKVQSYDIITEDDEIPNLATGRGGTSFIPLFDRLLEEQLEELPVVYFSDLDGDFPENPIGNGVFWLIRKDQLSYGRTEVPFGTIVEIDD